MNDKNYTFQLIMMLTDFLLIPLSLPPHRMTLHHGVSLIAAASGKVWRGVWGEGPGARGEKLGC